MIRGYATRHGAGPFVSEDKQLSEQIPDLHNGENRWQEGFRVGYADSIMTRYAIDAVGGVDEIVVTCLDRMKAVGEWKTVSSYSLDDAPSDLFETNDQGLVVGIKFLPGENLDRQEAITNALQKSSPIYQGVETPSGNGKLVAEDDIEAYLDVMTQQLKTPIRLTSFGPSATEKRRRL